MDMFSLYFVIPAGIAGIQATWMLIFSVLVCIKLTFLGVWFPSFHGGMTNIKKEPTL
jgi:hypothetical protein